MHRIDQPGHVANRFSTGNPQAGQLATRFGADWPNAVQEEICNVIEFAGIALDKLTNTQLRQAIVALIAGVVGSGGGSVPTTRQVLGAGLLAGQGGPLAADLTFNVPIASAAEVAAQVNNTKAITPASLASAFPRSLSTNGYVTIPFGGGFILQWLAGSVNANSNTIFTLPIAFPNACLGAFVNGGRADTGSEENDPFISGYGTANISVFSAANVAVAFNALAIGY